MSEQGLPASVPERRTSPRDHAVTHVMAWCRNSRLPAMLVKADGSVVWCNEAGAALLAEREHFHLRSEKLTCIDSGQDPALRAFVGKDGNDLATWIVQGDSSMLIVLREDIPGKDLRGLTFHSAEASVGYLWADFGPVLGMTGAEVRVAQRLMDGAGAEAISRDLGVGIETVRTHIRRIYNKLGIGSREELFARLSPFRLR